MEDFVVKYFTYFACIAACGWSIFMFFGMMANCLRMGRKYDNPGEKMSAHITWCWIEVFLYLLLSVACVAVVFYIHAKFNT